MSSSYSHAKHRVDPLPDRTLRFLLPVLVLLIFLLAAGFGILKRRSAVTDLREEALRAAIPTVMVTHPVPPVSSLLMALPGETQAYTEAPIYAQANGYLKSWTHDIGSRVRAGDVLGEIDTPALDQQHEQALATLKQSQAALALSLSTYNRYAELLKNKVISAQDFDNQSGDYKEKQAALANAEATLRQTEALLTFKSVRAPFDGIDSARNTDIGSLISSTSGTPLFIVSRVDPLRVYVNVPQTSAAEVRIGTKADITFDTYSGRIFPAEVSATAGAIDPKTRTMLVELSLPNPSGELLPGSYATVKFHVPDASAHLCIPANALLFRSEGTAVGVVGRDNMVEIRKVTISKDLGETLEISGGLLPSDRIILNPSDSLSDGVVVEVESPK